MQFSNRSHIMKLVNTYKVIPPKKLEEANLIVIQATEQLSELNGDAN